MKFCTCNMICKPSSLSYVINVKSKAGTDMNNFPDSRQHWQSQSEKYSLLPLLILPLFTQQVVFVQTYLYVSFLILIYGGKSRKTSKSDSFHYIFLKLANMGMLPIDQVRISPVAFQIFKNFLFMKRGDQKPENLGLQNQCGLPTGLWSPLMMRTLLPWI